MLDLAETWSKLSDDERITLETLSFRLWCRNRVEKVDNRRFSLQQFPYLQAIYEDQARKMVIEKSAQMGMTVHGVLESFHKTWSGHNWLYIFPTARLVSKFVQGRYDILTGNNPRIAELVRDTDNTTVKNIGQGVIYFAGLGSTSKEGGEFEVISVPVDGITFDEREKMKPIKVKEARSRISASPWKFERHLSTPGLPLYGIDEEYQDSDKKIWQMKCPHCSKRWNVDGDDKARKLDYGDWVMERIRKGYLACPKCEGKMMTDEGIILGDWEAQQPGEDASGYHISKLYSPFVDCKDLLKAYNNLATPREVKVFWNNDLGFPYVDQKAILSAEMVLKLCGTEGLKSSGKGCYLGADVGGSKKGIHITILEPGSPLFRLVHLEVLREPDPDDPQAVEWIVNQFKTLIAKFQVRKFVIDAMPETRLSKAIVNRLRGKGWLCRYNDSQKGDYAWSDEGTPMVQVNRTESLDNSHDLLQKKLVLLPKRCEVVEEFAEHCASIVRDEETDEDTGKKVFTWKKIGRYDDFRHSFNYATIAAGYDGSFKASGYPVAMRVPENIREMITN